MRKIDRLFTIADSQHGYFTAAQAIDCGYYASHFHRHVDAHDWLREGRGIYRLTRYPPNDDAELMKWSLWSRDKSGEIQGVWSHETALYIHLYIDHYTHCNIEPLQLDMTVPRHFRRSVSPPALLKLYFADLQPGDWVPWRRYRVTTLVRTLVDVVETGKLSYGALEQTMKEARRRGIFTKQERDSLPDSKAGALLKGWYEQR